MQCYGREIDLDGPICNLPRGILKPLCAYLSVESSVDLMDRGGDWRDLADHVGFPTTIIYSIQSSNSITKAFKFFQVWDTGVRKNPGTVRKLMIALHEAGFDEYLKKYLLCHVIEGEGYDDDTYISFLRSSISDDPIFPPLDLNDVSWDKDFEEHTICVTRSSSPTNAKDEWPGTYVINTVEENVYISYVTRSQSSTYTREVKNIICLLENYGYRVFYENPNCKYVDLNAQKERWIRSAANVLVVFNKEYRKAHESFISGGRLPSCLQVDVPLISHMFRCVPGGSSRIIPIVIDRCRTQPRSDSFPLWLTGTPRRLFPSQSRELLACIQNVPCRKVKSTTSVRVFKTDFIDGDEVRRQFFASKKSQ